MGEQDKYFYILVWVDIGRIDDDEVRKRYARSLNAYGMNSPGSNEFFEPPIEHLEFVESFEVWLANPFAQRFIDAPPWDCFGRNIPFDLRFGEFAYFNSWEEAHMAATYYACEYTDDGTDGEYAVVLRKEFSHVPRKSQTARDGDEDLDFERYGSPNPVAGIYRYNCDCGKGELVDRKSDEFDELAEAIYHHFSLYRRCIQAKNYTWV